MQAEQSAGGGRTLREMFLQLAQAVTPLEPPPAYSRRVIGLACCVALLPVCATVLLALHTVSLQRRGERLWLYRLIKRQGGR